MNTKTMTREEAEKQIDILTKRIDFNNKLNKMTRKFMKEHEMGFGAKNNFNGYWDEPTNEMREAMTKFFNENDTSWMSDSLRKHYLEDTAAIFGGVYSPAVNTYVLKDLHDCEKFLKTLETSTTKGDEENDEFRVERDTNENRINLYFDSIPDEDVRKVLKTNGFKWSPKRECWTRQLTDNAEHSLERIKKALNIA